MRSGSRSNALLVELLIVVLFFMISATVLMQIFSAARMQGERSGELTRAGADAQNLAEILSASEDPEMTLEEMGFVPDNGIETMYRLEDSGLVTLVQCFEEIHGSGILMRQQIEIYKNDDLLVELPAARYQEGQQ